MKKVYDGIKVAILACGKDPILESETEYNDALSEYDNLYVDEF